MISNRFSALFIAVTLSLAGATFPSAASNVTVNYLKTDIHFDWNPVQRKVTITSFSGCRSSLGVPALQSDFEVLLDKDYRQFDIQGGYTISSVEARKLAKTVRIGSADCMGSREERIELFVEARERYVINRRGYHVRDVVLGNEAFSVVIPDERYNGKVKTPPVKKPAAMFMIAE